MSMKIIDNKVYITGEKPNGSCKVDVVCRPSGNPPYEVYYNNFVIYENGLFWDSLGNKIDDVVGWRYR